MVRGLWLILNTTGIPRLVLRLMLDPRVPLRLKMLIPAALVYLISPIDLLPDIVPLLTHIDDLIVLLLAVGIFLAQAPRAVVIEHIRGGRLGPTSGPSGPADSGRKPDVIEGSYRYVDDGDKRGD